MTVYLVTVIERNLVIVSALGINSDQDSAKARAEAHWNNKHNAALRWHTYEDSLSISAQPVGKTDTETINVSYFVQPFEVDK